MAIPNLALSGAAYIPQFFTEDVDAYRGYPTFWLSDDPSLRNQFRRFARVNGWTRGDFEDRDALNAFLNGLQTGGINLNPLISSRRAPLASGNWSLSNAYGEDNIESYGKALHNLYGAYSPDRENDELNIGATPMPRYDKFDEALADQLLYRQFSAVLPMDVPEVKELVKAHMQNGDSVEKTVRAVRHWMTNDGQITIEQFLKNSEPTAGARVLRTLTSLPPIQFINNEIFQRNAPNHGIVDEDMGEALENLRNVGLGASFIKGGLNPLAQSVHGLKGLPIKALAGLGNHLGPISAGTKMLGSWWDVEDNAPALKRHIIAELAKGNDPSGANLSNLNDLIGTGVGTFAELGAAGALTGNTNTRRAYILYRYKTDPKFREEYDKLYDEVLQSDLGKQFSNTRINPETGKREVIDDFYERAGKGLGTFGKNTMYAMAAPSGLRLGMAGKLGLSRSFISPAAALKLNAYLTALGAAGGAGAAGYNLYKNGLGAARKGSAGTDQMMTDLERSLGKGDLYKYITNNDGSLNMARYLKASGHQMVGDVGKLFTNPIEFGKSRVNIIADWINTKNQIKKSESTIKAADNFLKNGGLDLYRKYKQEGMSTAEASKRAKQEMAKKSASDILTFARKEAASGSVPSNVDDLSEKRRAAAEKLNAAHSMENPYTKANWNNDAQAVVDAFRNGGEGAVAATVKDNLYTPMTIFNGGVPYMKNLRQGYNAKLQEYDNSLSSWIPFLNRTRLTPAGRAWQDATLLKTTMERTASQVDKYLPFARFMALLGGLGLAYGGYKAYRSMVPQRNTMLSQYYGQ